MIAVGMRKHSFIAAFGAGAAMVSCSLLTTFDGYVASDATDAAVDGHAQDSSAQADANGGPDGTAGGADAAPGDGSTTRWCLSQTVLHSFCDDFDDPNGGFATWSAVQQQNGATATEDNGDFTSAPRSLVTATNGAAQSSPAYLELKSPSIMKHVTFAFDYKIDVRDTVTGYAEVAYIRFDNQTDFYLRVRDDPTANGYTAEVYLDGGMPAQHNGTLPSTISFDKWHRVSIDLDVGAGHMVVVSVDGTPAVTMGLESGLYTPGIVTVSPGYQYNGYPSGPWKMRFDNVTVDWN